MNALARICTAASAAIVASSAFATVVQFKDFTGTTPLAGWTQGDVRDSDFFSTMNYYVSHGASPTLTITNYDGEQIPHAVIKMADLFTQLPAVNGNGQALQINSAQLSLTWERSFTVNSLRVRRVLSTWEESYVGASWQNPTPWANEDLFADGDITTTNQLVLSNFSGAIGGTSLIEVTQLIKDIYTSGVNQGLEINTTAPVASGYYIYLASSESVGIDTTWDDVIDMDANLARPGLVIDYQYVTVPEPTSLGLLTLAAAGLLRRGRA